MGTQKDHDLEQTVALLQLVLSFFCTVAVVSACVSSSSRVTCSLCDERVREPLRMHVVLWSYICELKSDIRLIS